MLTPPQTFGEKGKKSLQSSLEAKDAKRSQLVTGASWTVDYSMIYVARMCHTPALLIGMKSVQI